MTHCRRQDSTLFFRKHRNNVLMIFTSAQFFIMDLTYFICFYYYCIYWCQTVCYLAISIFYYLIFVYIFYLLVFADLVSRLLFVLIFLLALVFFFFLFWSHTVSLLFSGMLLESILNCRHCRKSCHKNITFVGYIDEKKSNSISICSNLELHLFIHNTDLISQVILLRYFLLLNETRFWLMNCCFSITN